MNPYKEALDEAHGLAARYLDEIDARRVGPSEQAIADLEGFEEPFPEHSTPAIETIRMLDHLGAPATMATQGGRYFGLVVGGALPATVGAQWLAAAWDQLALSGATSPVAIKLETVAAKWILEALNLPRHSSIGFVTGTTMGHFTCLAGARGELLRRQGYDLFTRGFRSAPPIRVVVSDEIHVSVLKALSLLGFGDDEIERTPTDTEGRIIAEELPALTGNTIVVCQAGNVNTGAFDPFRRICTKAAETGAWVHVDGAFGLWSRASSSKRALTAGIEQCDSWASDTHKWLNTPWDCGLAICRHPETIRRAMATQASYVALGDVYTPKDFVPEFGRRARGIEVWAALRSLGRAGLGELIDNCCRHARRFAEGLRGLELEVLNDVVLNQVIVAANNGAANEALMKSVQQAGDCWIGPTTWKGRSAIRVSVASWRTSDADVERSLAAIARSWAHLK